MLDEPTGGLEPNVTYKGTTVPSDSLLGRALRLLSDYQQGRLPANVSTVIDSLDETASSLSVVLAGREQAWADAATLTTRLAEADDRAVRLINELADFKAKVRDIALDVRAEEGWCVSGFNDVMDRLGLDRLVEAVDVTMSVGTFTISELQVRAGESADAAVDRLKDVIADGIQTALRTLRGSYSDHDAARSDIDAEWEVSS